MTKERDQLKQKLEKIEEDKNGNNNDKLKKALNEIKSLKEELKDERGTFQ